MCAVAQYFDISSKADWCGDILVVYHQTSSYCTPLTSIITLSLSHIHTHTHTHTKSLHTIKRLFYEHSRLYVTCATVVHLFIAQTNFFIARATYVLLYSPALRYQYGYFRNKDVPFEKVLPHWQLLHLYFWECLINENCSKSFRRHWAQGSPV